MPDIDSRLLDADCTEKIEENFNRTLALIDEGSGGGGGVMQCVISRDPDTGDYVADKPFADVFSAIYDGETVQIYIDGSPTIQPHAGGSGTAQDPYIIDFYGFSVTTNGTQPTQMYVSRYNWTEADGVQWQADGVATLSPAE